MVVNTPLDQALEHSPMSFLRSPAEPWFDGAYWQQCTPGDIEFRTQAVAKEVIRSSCEDLPIGVYQDYAELHRLARPSVSPTTQTLNHKLDEELCREYLPLFESVHPLSEGIYPEEDTGHLVDEGGDVLWVLASSASQHGVDLEKTISAKLGINTASITFGQLDQEIRRSPFWTPIDLEIGVCGIGEAEKDRNELDPIGCLVTMGQTAVRATRLLEAGERFTNYRGEAIQNLLGDPLVRVADAYADMLLLLTYYARQWSRASIAAYAAANFAKLEQRLKTNQIDKRNPR